MKPSTEKTSNRILLEGRNHYLRNRHPSLLGGVQVAPAGLILLGPDGRVIDNGILMMNASVYGCLYSEEVRNITFLLQRGGDVDIATLLFSREEDFRVVLEAIRSNYPGIRPSRQNRKLNRYAERLRDKLLGGNRPEIRDAVDESTVVYCPECGTQCEAGAAYCMECGVELK